MGIDAKPTIKINSQILGRYESKSSSDHTYTILKKDEYLYKVEKRSISSSTLDTYTAYLSNLDGVQFLNIYEDGSSQPTYYFYKLTISNSGSTITLTPVSEKHNRAV
jgi:hypothetical protein